MKKIIDKILNEIKCISTLFQDYGEKSDGTIVFKAHWCGKYICISGYKSAKEYLAFKRQEYVGKYHFAGFVRIIFHEFIISITRHQKIFYTNKNNIDVCLFSYYCHPIEISLNERLLYIGGKAFEDYNRLNGYGYFAYFLTPVISSKENVLCEKLVDYSFANSNDAGTFQRIILNYCKYIKKEKIEFFRSTCDIYSALRVLTIPDRYTVNCIIPYYGLHGDFHEENCLVTNDNELYVIDYEHTATYPFFFDIFTYAILRFISYNDDILVKRLFSNNSTEAVMVRNLFEIMGVGLKQYGFYPFFVITHAIYVERTLSRTKKTTERKYWIDSFNRLLSLFDEMSKNEK